MKAFVRKIEETKEERVIIECHIITSQVQDIVHFVDSRQEMIEGIFEEKIYQVPVSKICYVESVDNHLFVYTEKQVYEIKMKLYEFEEEYEGKQFFRCSKNVIVNLMKINFIKPALNGRFMATLENAEEVIISRKYVNDLKAKLKGESKNE